MSRWGICEGLQPEQSTGTTSASAHRGRCEVQLEQVASKFSPTGSLDKITYYGRVQGPLASYPVRAGAGAKGDETSKPSKVSEETKRDHGSANQGVAVTLSRVTIDTGPIAGEKGIGGKGGKHFK